METRCRRRVVQVLQNETFAAIFNVYQLCGKENLKHSVGI